MIMKMTHNYKSVEEQQPNRKQLKDMNKYFRGET